MRNVGSMNNGNRLVEMTEAEYNAFYLIIQTAEGKPLPLYGEGIRERDIDQNVDIFLSAVAEWMQVASRANELRHLADRIDMAIKVPELPRKESDHD